MEIKEAENFDTFKSINSNELDSKNDEFNTKNSIFTAQNNTTINDDLNDGLNETTGASIRNDDKKIFGKKTVTSPPSYRKHVPQEQSVSLEASTGMAIQEHSSFDDRPFKSKPFSNQMSLDLNSIRGGDSTSD